jgi:hypothetical protein
MGWRLVRAAKLNLGEVEHMLLGVHDNGGWFVWLNASQSWLPLCYVYGLMDESIDIPKDDIDLYLI